MISFILPVYNCYSSLINGLPSLIKILDGFAEPYEIIIVDDGSQDKTDISGAINKHCILLYNDKNYGKGYSVKKGVMYASGESIIFMDGDFPFDLDVVELSYKELKKPGVDMITGDRTLLASTDEHVKFMRSTGSKIFSFFVSKFFTDKFNDTQCGIKGFKKVVARDIFSELTIKGFSFDLEVFYIALKRKYNIIKIPVIVNKQLSSNVKLVFHGSEMIVNLFKIKLNDIRHRYKKRMVGVVSLSTLVSSRK